MKKILFLILILVLIVLVIYELQKSVTITKKELINDSINKAINFLYDSQLNDGEFKTYECSDPNLKNCTLINSPFITTFVLYSIKGIENEKIKPMTEKAMNFLLSEKKTGGLWSFYTSKSSIKLPPDLDDTSTVSFILKINNVNFDDNHDIIKKNVDKDNIFLTWINPGFNAADCIVNANVLLYLGENDFNVCSYINEAIKSDKSCSTYYSNKFSPFYMVSRAFENKITCFNVSREIIIERTLKKQNKDGSFGDNLDTALALNTLINFDYHENEIDLGIANLLKKQNNDGSWDRQLFFQGSSKIHYGSEELTTAISIEALKKYLLINKN
jgi:hypothetical protein